MVFSSMVICTILGTMVIPHEKYHGIFVHGETREDGWRHDGRATCSASNEFMHVAVNASSSEIRARLTTRPTMPGTMVKYHSEKYHGIFVHGILYHTRYHGNTVIPHEKYHGIFVHGTTVEYHGTWYGIKYHGRKYHGTFYVVLPWYFLTRVSCP